MPSGSLQNPFWSSVSIPSCAALGVPAEDKAGSSHILPTWHAVTCQPSNTLNCPQESLLLYLRNTHSSAWELPHFFTPALLRSPCLPLSMCPRETTGLRQGRRRRREEGWHLAEQPLPCATPQWVFPCPAPSRHPSLSPPVLSSCAQLRDLPGEHRVCWGDTWPELTSLQTVPK